MDRQSELELINSAQKLHEMGVLLDAEDLRDKAGLPKIDWSKVQAPTTTVNLSGTIFLANDETAKEIHRENKNGWIVFAIGFLVSVVIGLAIILAT